MKNLNIVLEQNATLKTPHFNRALVIVNHFPVSPRYTFPNVTRSTISQLARYYLRIPHIFNDIAPQAGFSSDKEPVFLNFETAQYYINQIVNEDHKKAFSETIVPQTQIARLLLNIYNTIYNNMVPIKNLSNILKLGLSLPTQLCDNIQKILLDYNKYCKTHNLLDYALTIDTYRYVLKKNYYRQMLLDNYDVLIVENIEEMPLIMQKIIESWMKYKPCILTYNPNGGFSHPANLQNTKKLIKLCAQYIANDEQPDPITEEVKKRFFDALYFVPRSNKSPITTRISHLSYENYHDMYENISQEIAKLLNKHEPKDVVILSPYIDEAQQFSLSQYLEKHQIPHLSIKPSEAIRDNIHAQMLITFAKLAHTQYGFETPIESVAKDMMTGLSLDWLEAYTLTQYIYDKKCGIKELDTKRARFNLDESTQKKYNQLYAWIAHYITKVPLNLPDFWRTFILDVLSTSGFVYYQNYAGLREAVQIIRSAQEFYHAMLPEKKPDFVKAYITTIEQGIMPVREYTRYEKFNQNTVLILNVHTYLQSQQRKKYQFWLDIESDKWWNYFWHPIVNPYVLSQGWDKKPWAAETDFHTKREFLTRIINELLNRCTNHVYLVSKASNSAIEDVGPLYRAVKQMF